MQAEAKPKAYGEVDIKDRVDGADLLQAAIEAGQVWRHRLSAFKFLLVCMHPCTWGVIKLHTYGCVVHPMCYVSSNQSEFLNH